MNLNTKVRLLQLFNHIMTIIGIYFYDSSWLWVILVSYFILGPWNISVTLHRLLTHRSFKTYNWLEKFMSFLTVYTTLGPTITWAGLHRYHHSYPDTETDTHSPWDNGKLTFRKAFSAWTGIGWEIPSIPIKFVKDLYRDSFHRFLMDNYFKIIFITLVILFIIDPLLPFYVYFIPSVLAFHGVSMINVLGHCDGYRNYDTKDKSTNSWITHLLTFEGLHNNHHGKPNSYYMGVRWYEFDILGSLIKLIKI